MNVVSLCLLLVFCSNVTCFAAGAPAGGAVAGVERRPPFRGKMSWEVPDEAWEKGVIYVNAPCFASNWKGITWCSYDNVMTIINPLRKALGLSSLVRNLPTKAMMKDLELKNTGANANQFLVARLVMRRKAWVVGFIRYWPQKNSSSKYSPDDQVIEAFAPVLQFSDYQGRGVEDCLLNALIGVVHNNGMPGRKAIRIIGVLNNHDYVRHSLVAAGFKALPRKNGTASVVTTFAAYTDDLMAKMSSE